MDARTNMVLGLSKIFAEYLTFNLLDKALRKRANLRHGEISVKLRRSRGFVAKLEAGRLLLPEPDMKKMATLYGLDDGHAADFAQKWREIYQTGLTKIICRACQSEEAVSGSFSRRQKNYRHFYRFIV